MHVHPLALLLNWEDSERAARSTSLFCPSRCSQISRRPISHRDLTGRRVEGCTRWRGGESKNDKRACCLRCREDVPGVMMRRTMKKMMMMTERDADCRVGRRRRSRMRKDAANGEGIWATSPYLVHPRKKSKRLGGRWLWHSS
jgi:hypothetical protein